jgi:hypothetical protein
MGSIMDYWAGKKLFRVGMDHKPSFTMQNSLCNTYPYGTFLRIPNCIGYFLL